MSDGVEIQPEDLKAIIQGLDDTIKFLNERLKDPRVKGDDQFRKSCRKSIMRLKNQKKKTQKQLDELENS